MHIEDYIEKHRQTKILLIKYETKKQYILKLKAQQYDTNQRKIIIHREKTKISRNITQFLLEAFYRAIENIVERINNLKNNMYILNLQKSAIENNFEKLKDSRN